MLATTSRRLRQPLGIKISTIRTKISTIQIKIDNSVLVLDLDDALVVLAVFLIVLTVLDAQTALIALVVRIVLVAHLAPDVVTDEVFKQVSCLVSYLIKSPVLLQGTFHVREDIMDRLLYIR